MAVLKKFRPRWWLSNRQASHQPIQPNIALVPPINARYDLRPLTVAQLDECWHLDQRCFVDGEAYSRDTFGFQQANNKTGHAAVLHHYSIRNRLRRSQKIFEGVAAICFTIKEASLIEVPTFVELCDGERP